MDQNQPNKMQNTQQSSQAKPSVVPLPAKSPERPVAKATKPYLDQKKVIGRRHNGVLLIGRSQLSLFVEGSTSIVQYPYTHDVISDLDVVNKDLLSQQLSALLQKNQFPPTNFSAVFANPTIFARQLLTTAPEQKKAEEEKFLDTVPFEEVSSRRVIMDGKTYVVAANKHFYDALCDAFEENGSEISLILPEFLLSKDANLTQGLTVQAATTLLHRMSAFREYNFIQKQAQLESSTVSGEQQDKKFKLQVTGGKSNQKFVIGGSVSMVIGVLFAGYLLMQQSSAKPARVLQHGPPPQAIPTVAVNPSATTSGQQASPSSSVQGAVSPTIIITYQQSQLPVANQLKAALAQVGYTAVTLQNSSVIAAHTYVVFNNYLSQAPRTVITNTVNSVSGNVTVYETKDAASDAVITLSSVK